jgi:hypothetical protein
MIDRSWFSQCFANFYAAKFSSQITQDYGTLMQIQASAQTIRPAAIVFRTKSLGITIEEERVFNVLCRSESMVLLLQ